MKQAPTYRQTLVRILGVYALALLLVGAGVAGLMEWLQQRTLLQYEQGRLQELGANYQRILQHSGADKLKVVLERDQSFLEHEQYQLRWWDEQGQVLFAFWPQAAEPLYYLDYPLPGGRLELGRLRHSAQAQLVSNRWWLLGGMLALALASLGLCGWLLLRLLLPLDALALTLQSILAQGLQQRPALPQHKGALGQLVQLFDTMLDQLQRLITGMKSSLDGIAHDLRTPLTRMRLATEQALSQQDPQQWRHALEDCALEREQLEQCLNTLLDIAKAEAGLLLKTQPVALHQQLAQLVELYGLSAEQQQIELQVDLQPLWVEGDAGCLQRVWGNLLDNALKHTPPQGVIQLQLRQQEDQVQVVIRDSGEGIATADLPHIFERLYRADKSRSSAGMGLGLSLVKALVEAHHGQIRVESQLGQGSCFCITLPRWKEA
ncbi:sensor histidine kinase [Balneatrix alpica]|uniref:sensor histidine kinase n=1 Tax=Balneatrix alpica TaxID=75684 RepID=UPI002738805F|nr:HAMP domain-containing sensor histidine kinase [Balneatrix alpica]